MLFLLFAAGQQELFRPAQVGCTILCADNVTRPSCVAEEGSYYYEASYHGGGGGRLLKCPVAAVQTDCFDGRGYAACIDLGGTGIESIEPGAFDGLSSVEVLYLSSNLLQTIDANTFRSLRALTWGSVSTSRASRSTKRSAAPARFSVSIHCTSPTRGSAS